MGREIKRVPIDFDWPRDKVWQGYLMPDNLEPAPCPEGEACCNGVTPARAWVAEIADLTLMLDDDLDDQRRGRPLHPYFASVHGYSSRPRPSVDIREFGTGLAGREASWLGHDACDGWRATEKLIAAAGLDPETWGVCPGCGGRASVEAYPGQRAEADAWTATDPPTGAGWQLWETTSEGSPISPVFPTAEGLAQWLTTTAGGNAVAFGGAGRPMTIEQARGFVDAGWSPSMVGTAGVVHDGAAYVGTERALGGGPDGPA